MTDNYTQLNPGVGGDVMDESAVTYPIAPLTRKRPRVVIAGDSDAAEIAGVAAASPAGDAIGLVVRPVERCGTSHVSRVPADASNTTLLAANPSRTMATIFNEGNSILHIKLGSIAASTDYTIQLFPNGYYELPAGYTGQIDGIWDIASGAAQVTELS